MTASRDNVGDVQSAVLPLVGTTFDSTQLSVNLVNSSTDYNVTIEGKLFSGTIDTGVAVPNTATGGTLTIAGNLATLTLPILGIGSVDVEGVDLLDVYSGQVVATAVVPEP